MCCLNHDIVRQKAAPVPWDIPQREFFIRLGGGAGSRKREPLETDGLAARRARLRVCQRRETQGYLPGGEGCFNNSQTRPLQANEGNQKTPATSSEPFQSDTGGLTNLQDLLP